MSDAAEHANKVGAHNVQQLLNKGGYISSVFWFGKMSGAIACAFCSVGLYSLVKGSCGKHGLFSRHLEFFNPASVKMPSIKAPTGGNGGGGNGGACDALGFVSWLAATPQEDTAHVRNMIFVVGLYVGWTIVGNLLEVISSSQRALVVCLVEEADCPLVEPLTKEKNEAEAEKDKEDEERKAKKEEIKRSHSKKDLSSMV